jgi:hypothetical protein
MPMGIGLGAVMRSFKFLLAGTAGLFAATGAQAAPPVEYVRICSLYGDGFYYIPGTDTCLKLGAYVRLDYGHNVSASPHTPNYFGVGGEQDRNSNSFSFQSRGELDIDARTQTQYGTLRTYIRDRIDNNGETVSTQVPRAFIQWAGFTFGRVKSLSDVVGLNDDRFGNYHNVPNMSGTGENGNNEISYTWELGNGATISAGAGERRVKPIVNLSNVVWDPGINPVSSIHGQQYPDPFVAFKVSQAWGRWDVSVTSNPIHSTYYTAAPGVPGYTPSGACAAQPGRSACEYPSDKWGWAVISGVEINTPWTGFGDYVSAFGGVSQGATSYLGTTFLDSPGLYGSGNKIALGAVTDAVYLNGSAFQLTTAWTAGGSFTHYWTPQFATTVFGAHTAIEYNDTVKNSRWFCGGGGATVQGVVVPSTSTCNPSFGYTTIGTHTDWYPVPAFRLGVELLYMQIDTAFEDQPIILPKSGSRPSGPYTAKNLGITSVMFRAERQWPAGGG